MMKPNILFILVDSLRADKLHGSMSVDTPNIDSLKKRGTYFENCFSSSDYTITGLGSLFTSMYPINASKQGMNYHKIFSNTPDLISILKENNYHVFSTLDSALFNLLKEDFTNFENNDQAYDRAKLSLFDGLGEKILNTLNSFQKLQPWFYFIHINDLHIPVRVPKEFEHKPYKERYELAVSNIDKWIGKIVEQVDLENTLVVITADHGDYILSYDDGKKESNISKLKTKIRKRASGKLYDSLSITKQKLQHEARNIKTKHDFEKRHLTTRTAPDRYLYDDVIHVPLLFAGPGVSEKNIFPNLVRSIDVSPTLIQLLNFHMDEKIDGRSLVPLFNGAQFKEEVVYLENTIFNTDVKTTKSHIGIRSSKYKYFRLNDSINGFHLYDIQIDPFERNNLAKKNPEIVKELESQLHNIQNKLFSKYEKIDLTEDETKKIEEELKKLGYI